MAVNSVNHLKNSSIHENNFMQTRQKKLIFSSKNNCFKKSLNLCSNPLISENNNNYYFNYNNNNNNNNNTDNNWIKNDLKQSIEYNELKLKSNIINAVESVDITSNSDSIDLEFSSPGMKDVPQWLKGWTEDIYICLFIYLNICLNNCFELLI